MQNPLMPAAYDFVWFAAVLVIFALVVIAFISIVRNRRSLTSVQTLVWVLLIFFLPVIGAVAWLISGRPARAERTKSVTNAV